MMRVLQIVAMVLVVAVIAGCCETQQQRYPNCAPAYCAPPCGSSCAPTTYYSPGCSTGCSTSSGCAPNTTFGSPMTPTPATGRPSTTSPPSTSPLNSSPANTQPSLGTGR